MTDDMADHPIFQNYEVIEKSFSNDKRQAESRGDNGRIAAENVVSKWAGEDLFSAVAEVEDEQPDEDIKAKEDRGEDIQSHPKPPGTIPPPGLGSTRPSFSGAGKVSRSKTHSPVMDSNYNRFAHPPPPGLTTMEKKQRIPSEGKESQRANSAGDSYTSAEVAAIPTTSKEPPSHSLDTPQTSKSAPAKASNSSPDTSSSPTPAPPTSTPYSHPPHHHSTPAPPPHSPTPALLLQLLILLLLLLLRLWYGLHPHRLHDFHLKQSSASTADAVSAPPPRQSSSRTATSFSFSFSFSFFFNIPAN